MTAGLEAALAAIPLVRRVTVLESTDSTNDDARRQGREGAPDGTVVVARSQSAGRGRLGRAWHSPSGAGLYLSVLLRPDEPPDRVGRYALVGALAALQACRDAGARESRIKWPNDVLAGGRKLAGILSELRSGAGGAELVLGFGVNVRTPETGFPTEIAATATSLSEEAGTTIEIASTAVALVGALDGWVARLRAGAWDEIRGAFVRYAPGVEGSSVTLHDGTTGVTRGLDDSGALRVGTSSGVLLVHGGASVAAWGS